MKVILFFESTIKKYINNDFKVRIIDELTFVIIFKKKYR